jgi:hypothetical protein
MKNVSYVIGGYLVTRGNKSPFKCKSHSYIILWPQVLVATNRQSIGLSDWVQRLSQGGKLDVLHLVVCLLREENPLWSVLRLLGNLYWHIRRDTAGEIGLICFSCPFNGRSLSGGKALTGLGSRWANTQTRIIGFLFNNTLPNVAGQVKPPKLRGSPWNYSSSLADWLSLRDK